MWFGRRNIGVGNFSPGTDAVFYYVFIVSAIFFVVLMGLMVYWAFKYRRVPGTVSQPSPAHHTQLEIAWSVIPTILFAIMFFWGLIEYLPQRVIPGNAENIAVTAKQWNWSLEYDNGGQPLESEILADNAAPIFALPVGRPVQFTLTSQDVVHSFYLPAFRVKRDVFPNMYTHVWVEAQKPSHQYDKATDSFLPLDELGGFYLACAEYCGDQHSQMWGRVITLNEDDYQIWKKKQASTDSIPLAELGEKLYKNKGCISCHSLDGSRGTGPSWKGIWGEQAKFRDGSSALVDDNYVRESVLTPAAKIVEGFTNQMQSFQGQLTDRELRALITFLKTLSHNPDDVSEAQEESKQELEEREQAKEEDGGGS